MDINSIVADFGAHNWLALVLLAAVYARTLFGPQSKFPVTFSPNWLPIFSALAGAVVVGDTALAGGKTLGTAVLLGVGGFVSGGAADGMIVAIFGDTTKAPTWAKAIVFFVDDVFGRTPPGGGTSVKVDVKVDAVTQAANEVTPATGTPLKRDWSALLPRRTPLALALACGLLAVGASTGANCNGTVSPQTQAEIQAALVLGDCIESVYAADSAKVPAVTPVQIAIDEGATCGADVANLVTLFGSSPVAGKVAVAQAAQANAAQVHAAALTHQGH